jgi:hypothetical protein
VIEVEVVLEDEVCYVAKDSIVVLLLVVVVVAVVVCLLLVSSRDLDES